MSVLVSGEGVQLELSHAGLGTRILAALIDISVQIIALIVLVLLDARLGGDSDGLTALLIVEVIMVLAGYPILCEWLSHGRTLGKLVFGLRVVRDDGGPIGFRQALVRGLAGLVLEKPGLFAPISTTLAMIVLGTNSASKRIGDMMAGTFVLNERAGPASALTAAPISMPWGLEGWAQSLDLSMLSDQLALAVRQFVLRAHQLTPAARDELGEQFRRQLVAVISPPPPLGTPTPALLMAVLAERRRRADRNLAC